MKDSKNLVIGLLCAVVCIMAVAYAAFSTTITVNGTATITGGNWKVGFNSVVCAEPTVEGQESITVDGTTYTVGATGGIVGTAGSSTSANFSATLLTPGDSVTCTVTVANGGTKNAVVGSLLIEPEDNEAPITYTVDRTNIEVGQTLNAAATTTFTVTATYNEDVKTQPSVLAKDLDITVVYKDAA